VSEKGEGKGKKSRKKLRKRTKTTSFKFFTLCIQGKRKRGAILVARVDGGEEGGRKKVEVQKKGKKCPFPEFNAAFGAEGGGKRKKCCLVSVTPLRMRGRKGGKRTRYRKKKGEEGIFCICLSPVTEGEEGEKKGLRH